MLMPNRTLATGDSSIEVSRFRRSSFSPALVIVVLEEPPVPGFSAGISHREKNWHPSRLEAAVNASVKDLSKISGCQTFACEGSPSIVPPKILPQALQPPDHV
jgi:hypothetical protein